MLLLVLLLLYHCCCCVSPGQERYGNMTRVYYREAVGALVIFDMTRASTFQAVLKWKGDLDSKVRDTLIF